MIFANKIFKAAFILMVFASLALVSSMSFCAYLDNGRWIAINDYVMWAGMVK